MSAATDTLTILGRTADGFYLCWEVQQETGTTTLDLAELRQAVVASPTGTVEFEGNTLDESMVTELIEADARDDSPIWPVTPCADCGTDAVVEIEGRPLCAGHAAGFGAREQEGGR